MGRHRQQDMGESAHAVADMPTNLLQIVESTTLGAQTVFASAGRFHAVVPGKSKSIDDSNFTTIHPTDLEPLLPQHDNEFFDEKFEDSAGRAPAVESRRKQVPRRRCFGRLLIRWEKGQQPSRLLALLLRMVHTHRWGSSWIGHIATRRPQRSRIRACI